MKRFFFFLFFITGILNANAQTYFITAGQTQGMMFTDYVPDKDFSPAIDSGIVYDTLDLNKDSIPDLCFVCQYHWNEGSHLAGSFYKESVWAIALNQNIQIDFNHNGSGFYGSPCIPPTDSLYQFCKLLRATDTIIPLNATNVIDSNTYLFIQTAGVSHCFSGLMSDSMYISGRMFSQNDTSIFYVHLTKSNKTVRIADFAIEGHDTTFIISSINNLSNNNSIAVYPNPFTSSITTSYNKAFDYQITDYSGRVVQQGKAEKSIATDKLAAGNYLLLMKNEEMYSVKRIVKMNE